MFFILFVFHRFLSLFFFFAVGTLTPPSSSLIHLAPSPSCSLTPSKKNRSCNHVYFLDMNSVVRRLSSLFRQSGCAIQPFNGQHHQLLQPCRGIRVDVRNGNLEQALTFLQRKMTSSGIERMIKHEQRFHIKNSEKRVLARKSLERRLRSEDLARKLKSIMIKKVRGL
ncbi:unnamed protein product [Trifolium pratense]|uniref:Uncharacterized protein n=1 Tax=Trifolium pratense TaxID=57577 RepID=A0ACB0J700_TRIPR|nr:unnamed protein product [Trifolium pratense]